MLNMKRINCNDVTDTLTRAMEHAEDMQSVIVLYETSETNKDASGGILTSQGTSMSKINWLIDMAKYWLWDLSTKEE